MLRCAGEGPGRRLEGVQPSAFPVRAERGGQGPEAEKEMLSKAGDRRPVGTHKNKELGARHPRNRRLAESQQAPAATEDARIAP